MQPEMLAGSNSCCQYCRQIVLICATIIAAGNCSMHSDQAQFSCCSSGRGVHQHHVQPSKQSNRQKSQQQRQMMEAPTMPTRMLVLTQLTLSGVQWLRLASSRVLSNTDMVSILPELGCRTQAASSHASVATTFGRELPS